MQATTAPRQAAEAASPGQGETRYRADHGEAGGANRLGRDGGDAGQRDRVSGIIHDHDRP